VKKHRLTCKMVCSKRRKKRNRKNATYKINCIIKRINIFFPKQPMLRVKPKVKRYFFVAPEDIDLTGEKLVLLPHQFVDDKGETVTKFIGFGQEGYFNLYVNGALQKGKIYHVNSDELSIIATGQTIYKGTPIILESIGMIMSRKNRYIP
jgi:hypothetical protein